ncbi:MAG: U32 family peptidase [Clostridiales bacterium]|nr:U32 family peptidase [Clostridiales bacterium]
MTRPELLAPAGNPEGLRAAIAAGADAVYLGASAFSARASAGFDDQTLADAIRLSHLHGRRVYVAVNTLIKQQEWPGLSDLLLRLGDLGPDAVLVQDLGVLSQIKETLPRLQVHASTQMAVHNAHGARFLLESGISRVVTARECTLNDIRQIADTGIETEVFVHGALCVSVSGQCLLSSQIGGRSGNRGRCAQPCRLNYRYKDQAGALLSMRDLNTLAHLPQLLDAGVVSFKIEGRLKRPEYISEVVSIYRHALDLAEARQELQDANAYQERLAQVFSRGGFTRGHLLGAEDFALIGKERVSHEGIRLGRIQTARRLGQVVLAECRLEKDLNDGDGLQIRGAADQEIIYSGKKVPAGTTATLRLRQMPRPGDAIYRLADEAQLAKARIRAEQLPRIPFSAELMLSLNQPARLLLKAGEAVITVSGDMPSPAKNQALDETSARAYLGKTGETPFVLEKLRVSADSPLFMPAASINQLRREGLMALEEAVISGHKPPVPRPWALQSKKEFLPVPLVPRLYMLVRDLETYQVLKQAGLGQLIFAPGDFRPGRLEAALSALDQADIIALPPQIRDQPLKDAFALISRSGHPLMLANVGQLALPHSQPFWVGEGIPVWNKRAASALNGLGARGICLSRELAREEIAQLGEGPAEWILPVYGRSAVMLLNHCPERVRRGLSAKRAGCRLCDKGQGIRKEALKDRFQAAYPLLPTHFEDGCLITLYHHTALNLLDKAPGMSWLLDFSDESPEEALAIARAYHALQQGKPASCGQPAMGRFLEGVL